MDIPKKNWHRQEKDNRTFGQKIADNIADIAGSWTFFFVHVIWFGAWLIMDIEPFPYGLLTMIVSLEAIFLSTFILISQNRQEERDRSQAHADYETNIRAKEEIEELQASLARIENEKLDKILNLLGPVKKPKAKTAKIKKTP